MDHAHHSHNHNHNHNHDHDQGHDHNHSHDQGHDHSHDHHHDHDHHQHDQKGTDSDDFYLVENRDLESNKRWSNKTIANHVWDACKPHANIMVKSPTVSARRVQLMRAQFQHNSTDWSSGLSNESLAPPCINKLSSCTPKSKSKKSIHTPDGSLSNVVHACPGYSGGREENKQDDFR